MRSCSPPCKLTAARLQHSHWADAPLASLLNTVPLRSIWFRRAFAHFPKGVKEANLCPSAFREELKRNSVRVYPKNTRCSPQAASKTSHPRLILSSALPSSTPPCACARRFLHRKFPHPPLSSWESRGYLIHIRCMRSISLLLILNNSFVEVGQKNIESCRQQSPTPLSPLRESRFHTPYKDTLNYTGKYCYLQTNKGAISEQLLNDGCRPTTYNAIVNATALWEKL